MAQQLPISVDRKIHAAGSAGRLWMPVFLVALWLGRPALGAESAKVEAAKPETPAAVAGDDAPLDYQTLSLTVSVESLRAGSHDASGVNDYYLKAQMYGLVNTPEERNLPFAERKKIPVDLGTFGETRIDALAFWRPDEKGGDTKTLALRGDTIRELVARIMQAHAVVESQVSVMVEVTLLEKAKRWWFLGEDTTVAKTAFMPLPATKFDTPLRTNSLLSITDDKGTHVKLAVRYDKPATAAAAGGKPSAAESAP